jgi:hypothetical protein
MKAQATGGSVRNESEPEKNDEMEEERQRGLAQLGVISEIGGSSGIDNEYNVYKKNGEVDGVDKVGQTGGDKIDIVREVNLDRGPRSDAITSYLLGVEQKTVNLTGAPFESYIDAPGVRIHIISRPSSGLAIPVSGPEEFAIGGLYYRLGKLAFSFAAKGGQTIIGEGMKRVSMEAAKRPGSVILNNMPEFTGTAEQVTSQMMTYNRQWILQQMRSGRPILDIGIDATRTNRSIFYQMEQNMIRNYLKLHPNALQVIKP